MARRRGPIVEGDYILFRTPDGKTVAIPGVDMRALWQGQETGTMVVERADDLEPITVLGSVTSFVERYCSAWDDRRYRGRGLKVSGNAPQLQGDRVVSINDKKGRRP